jgi:hypothetical protein
VRVPISPITLEYGKKYWIVQSAIPSSSTTSNSIVWLYDTKRIQRSAPGALSQSGYYNCCPSSSYVGPWKSIKGGVPFARVRESVGVSVLNHPPRSQGARDGSISPVVVPTRRGGHERNIPRYPP